MFNRVYDKNDSTQRANAVIQNLDGKFIIVGTGVNVSQSFGLKTDIQGNTE